MAAKENNINWHDFFYYDASSPSGLRWKVARYHGTKMAKMFRDVGDTVGGSTNCKSWRVKFGPEHYFVSRVIFEMHSDFKLKSSDVVDHIDGNRLNNIIDNLRLVNCSTNNRNVKMHVDNTSGVVGVGRQSDSNGRYHWVSTTYNLDGSRTRKCFSESKYGEDAFRMACEFRQKQIEILNEQGAGYSERHGK